MKIVVKEKDHNFRLRFPTGLVLNRVTAAVICRELKKYGLTLTYKQAVVFVTVLNTYRRAHREWNLVEVQSANGESVQIKL